MMLILGKSLLAEELAKLYPDAEVVGRPEYDFSCQADCDRLIAAYAPNILINTVGVMSTDTWHTLTTNFVSAVYVSLGFYEKIRNLHVINISSASTYWVSYPEIDTARLCYNLSKENLSNFSRHMTRKTIDDPDFLISIVEPGRFGSKINDFAPDRVSVDAVVAAIQQVIEQRITHIALVK